MEFVTKKTRHSLPLTTTLHADISGPSHICATSPTFNPFNPKSLPPSLYSAEYFSPLATRKSHLVIRMISLEISKESLFDVCCGHSSHPPPPFFLPRASSTQVMSHLLKNATNPEDENNPGESMVVSTSQVGCGSSWLAVVCVHPKPSTPSPQPPPPQFFSLIKKLSNKDLSTFRSNWV